MRLLAGPVVAAKGPQEITADARVLVWQEESGLNGSFHKSGLIRGTVLNFPEQRSQTPGNQGTTSQSRSTKCILVDMVGGEDKDRKLTSPGMILVMDDSGNLAIHDEAAEGKEWDEASKEPEPSVQPPPRSPTPPPEPHRTTPDRPRSRISDRPRTATARRRAGLEVGWAE